MMTDKYCPRGEIKKPEFKMWNLKKKYVGGLPDTIYGSVMTTKPKTMQDAIEFATELMDKKINIWAERQADNKRKSDDTARNNQNQQLKRDKTLEELMPQEMVTGDHTKGLNLCVPNVTITMMVLVLPNATRSGYQQKDRKPSQNDKTEHGMEKTVQNQGQSPKMPKSESI
ncbi:hypothetical protein Tco_0161326, partial [Tanacetum coccineum]